MMDRIASQPRPLGRAGQQPLRQVHHRTKTQALALQRWAEQHAISARSVADHLGVAVQTLADWNAQRRLHRLDVVPRGRPPHTPSIQVQSDVLELLEERRGRLGLPFLKDAFRDVPRTVLKQIKDRYVCDHDGSMECLTWKLPGRVWAADFTQADAPIDGVYPYVLSVRDLASSYQLLSWPVRQADASATVCALTYLFAAYGPPLVLKTDNGSHFTEEHVGKLLSAAGVTVLLSPPKTPRYNGSEEAGIGSLKTRALHIAAAQGRADHWTCDDVEAARIEANLQARPLGKNGPTPIQLWEARRPVAGAERLAFLRRLTSARIDETQKLIDPLPGSRPAADVELGAKDRATVARRATRRVLLELGYLLVRRIAN
jgi:transposase InsO family protein